MTKTIEDNGLATIVGADTSIFHGTTIEDITQFEKGIEDTLGTGIYFTSQRKPAEGYAKVREGRGKGKPLVYEAKVPDAKFVDLRDIPTLHKVMEGYVPFLEEWHKKEYANEEDAEIRYRDCEPDKRLSFYWIDRKMDRKKIEEIKGNVERKAYMKIGIKSISYVFPWLFSEYLQSLGYEGLIAFEGGESGNGVTIGNHDSWVVFEPEKTNIQIISKKFVEN